MTVEVLTGNAPAVAFWRSVGYKDYCLRLGIMPTADGEHAQAPAIVSGIVSREELP